VSWSETPEGWWAAHPTVASKVTAEREALERAPGERDKRWESAGEQGTQSSRVAGRLVERGFEFWLRQHGINFERDGGINSRPDFVVAQLDLEVKTRLVGSPMRRYYNVGVPYEHVGKDVDLYVFAAYEWRVGRALLLGVMTKVSFMATAEPPTGRDALIRAHPGLVVKAEALDPMRSLCEASKNAAH
jgi:hypothetical protein